MLAQCVAGVDKEKAEEKYSEDHQSKREKKAFCAQKERKREIDWTPGTANLRNLWDIFSAETEKPMHKDGGVALIPKILSDSSSIRSRATVDYCTSTVQVRVTGKSLVKGALRAS